MTIISKMEYGKAKAEAVEDIEILRFIENGYRVLYVEVESGSVAVDTQNDLEKVRRLIGIKCGGIEKNPETINGKKNPGGGISVKID